MRARQRFRAGSLLTACFLLALAAPAFAAPALAAEDPPRPTAAQAEPSGGEAPGLAESISSGKVTLDLRYRYELLDQDGFEHNGLASTLRTVLGYTTRPYAGFSVSLQAESVTDIGGGGLHRNLGVGDRDNGVRDRPVIADPPGTEMLQAYLEYAQGATTAKAGRQEIALDDHRFVGNVGFRQHHQSYRALRLGNASIGHLQAQYAYIDRVYQITGARQGADHHLINLQYELAGAGALTGYAYVLRYDDEASRRLNTDTFGAEFKGQRDIGGATRVLYEVEYAAQSDAGNNPARVSQNYLHLMAGGSHAGFSLRAGWERLGGSLRAGQFQTPLATLHAFNGWADKFLATPGNGLEDFYIRADGPAGALAWILVYHSFKAATGSGDYGTEFDFQLTYRTCWKQVFGFRGAVYGARDFSTDTTKIWLYSTYSF